MWTCLWRNSRSLKVQFLIWMKHKCLLFRNIPKCCGEKTKKRLVRLFVENAGKKVTVFSTVIWPFNFVLRFLAYPRSPMCVCSSERVVLLVPFLLAAKKGLINEELYFVCLQDFWQFYLTVYPVFLHSTVTEVKFFSESVCATGIMD